MILALWHLPAPVVGCAISSLIGLLIGLLVSVYIKTKGNSATDHVSKVQVEPDGVFYNSVAGVARQCVGRR
jgi:hypothetical protein